MNILSKYILKISGVSYQDMKRILKETHPTLEIVRKGPMTYFIRNKETNRLYNLKCVSESYTTNDDCSKLKLPANSSARCLKTKHYFNLNADNPNCRECHKKMIELFEKGKINIIRK